MKLLDFQEKVRAHGVKVFTAAEFQRLMKLKSKAAHELLSRYAKKGAIIKLRNNYYAPASNMPSTYLLSNKIYAPSYISFETALSHHGIIPETVYEVTAATSKATRAFNVQEKTFVYHKIKRTAYTGYTPTKVDGDVILLAEPEKALADYLYFVHLGRKTLNERMRLDEINKKKLLNYSRLYDRKKFRGFVENAVSR